MTPALQAISDGGTDPLDILRYVNAFETLISALAAGLLADGRRR